MRKLFGIVFILVGALILSTLVGCGANGTNSLKKITLNEVAHSIFYAPQYVAYEKGYFKEQGLDVHIVTGFGADKTMTALISGDADIGFMGSEASIYQYNEGNEDYAINFAQLTQRAGNFLVSRENDDNFQWSELNGKSIIGGRKGGMPQMILEYVLKKHGLNPETDVELIQNVDFANTAGAFSGGTGDYTVEFEPNATTLEQQGSGYVVSSLGVESGYVPYTAYCAKKSYIEKHHDLIQKFTNAIYKGQQFVATHTPEEIAKVIKPQFPETDLESLTSIIKRYAEQDTYKENPLFEEDSFALLQEILNEAGELSKPVDYSVLVDTTFATAAMK